MTRNELVEALAYELEAWEGLSADTCADMAEDWADEYDPDEYEDPSFKLGDVSTEAERRVRDQLDSEYLWAAEARWENANDR